MSSLISLTPEITGLTHILSDSNPNFFNGPKDFRQIDAITRFINCKDQIQNNILLLHKVGTGKTITSLLIALNLIEENPGMIQEIIIVAPKGIYKNFIDDYTKILGPIPDIKVNLTSNEHAFNQDIHNIIRNLRESPSNNRKVDEYQELYGRVTEFKVNKRVVLVDYDYEMLYTDINTNTFRYDLTDKIIIFDEAHRLLNSELINSRKSSGVLKHPTIEDPKFINLIRDTKKIIALSGTPLQRSCADLCKFSNFLTKSNDYTLKKYAQRKLTPAIAIFLLRHWELIVGILTIYTGSNIDTKIIENLFTDKSNFWLKLIINHMIPTITLYFSYILVSNTIADNKSTLRDLHKGGTPQPKFSGGNNYEIVYKILINFIGIKALTEILTIKTYTVEVNNFISDLEEPYFNVKQLSKDMSPFISIYDYELQDRNCSNSKDPGPINNSLKLKFPKQIIKNVKLNYTNEQLLLQYKYIIGMLDEFEMEIFGVDVFGKKSMDIVSKMIAIKLNAKFIGNYSTDLNNYIANIDPSVSYQKYKYTKRNQMVDNIKGNIFECAKFIDICDKIVFLSQHYYYYPPDFDGIQISQPHAYCKLNPDDEPTHYYLPLVYSYNENYGTAPFSCYLESQNIPYILIHILQETKAWTQYEPQYWDLLDESDRIKIEADRLNLLEYNKYIGFKCVFPLNNNACPKCVIIDPTMTEGLDAKFSPAIFVVEPCDSYGDHEQVYGRILRKYDFRSNMTLWTQWEKNRDPDDNRYRKVIYQYIMTENMNIDNQIKSIKEICIDLFNQSPKFGLASYNPLEYVVNGLKFAFQYPDVFSYKKIKHEEQNLQEFEMNLEYNIFCNDKQYNQKCMNPSGMDALNAQLFWQSNDGEDKINKAYLKRISNETRHLRDTLSPPIRNNRLTRAVSPRHKSTIRKSLSPSKNKSKKVSVRRKSVSPRNARKSN